MTDGILLAEVPNDRLLTNYDTIIVDEARLLFKEVCPPGVLWASRG